MEQDDFLTIGPVSRLLCISAEHIRTLEKKGVLPAIRCGRLRLFKRCDVERLRVERETVAEDRMRLQAGRK